jgi:hypothetical protein
MVWDERGPEVLDLENTTQEEINYHLNQAWRHRQPLYNMYANALMFDYAPDFAKLARVRSEQMYGHTPENNLMLAVQNMESYMLQGWETGILNTFHTLTRNGLTKGQIFEIVMFSQLYSGMQGLGHVYRAAGDLLAVLMAPPRPPVFPKGWAADPAAFKSGLDLTRRDLTLEEVKSLTAWYERTIGYLPPSIEFAMKIHPEFVKANRAKWETAIKTLPKQFAPYIMIRHNMVVGSSQGLRESVLLAKAWGIDREWIVRGVTGSAFFFTGFEGMYVAQEALHDLL